MSNKRTIIWLFLLTLVALGANFILLRTTPLKTTMRKAVLSATFEPTKLTIASAKHPPIVLDRTDVWRLISPVVAPADSTAVLRLLDLLVASPVEESLSETELLRLGRTRADFELDPPRLVLTLANARESQTLCLGAFTPSSNGVYAVKGGTEEVLVLDSAIARAADRECAAFRCRDIALGDAESVASFEIRRPGESILSFVRTGNGWRLGDLPASTEKVADLLSRLFALKARDFIWPREMTNGLQTASSSLLSGYGLEAETAIIITWRETTGMLSSLSLGSSATPGKVYALAKDGREIVSVDEAFRDFLRQDSVRFTDARLFPLPAADGITSFSLGVQGTTYALARQADGSWHLDAPIAAPADGNAVKAILSRILMLTSADLDSSGVRLTVNTNCAPFVVSSEALLGPDGMENLRSREILRIDPIRVKRLVSTPLGNKTHAVSLVYARDRRLWAVETSPLEGVANVANVDAILKELSSLKASRIVMLKASESDLMRYGLGHPAHVLSVDQEMDGGVRRNLLIGAKTPEGSYATVGSADAIFLLSNQTVQTLLLPLIN